MQGGGVLSNIAGNSQIAEDFSASNQGIYPKSHYKIPLFGFS
jgi:hypothetical protein